MDVVKLSSSLEKSPFPHFQETLVIPIAKLFSRFPILDFDFSFNETQVIDLTKTWGYQDSLQETKEDWFLSLCKIWVAAYKSNLIQKNKLLDGNETTIKEKKEIGFIIKTTSYTNVTLIKPTLVQSIHKVFPSFAEKFKSEHGLDDHFFEVLKLEDVEKNRLVRIFSRVIKKEENSTDKEVVDWLLEICLKKEVSSSFYDDILKLLINPVLEIRDLDPKHFQILETFSQEELAIHQNFIKLIAQKVNLIKLCENESSLNLLEILNPFFTLLNEPAIHAVIKNKIDLAIVSKYLIKAFPSKENPETKKPILLTLMEAQKEYRNGFIKLLKDKNILLETSSYPCYEELQNAILENQPEKVTFLLENGVLPEFDQQGKENLGPSPLSLAVIQGNVEITKLLLKHGGNPDQKDEWGGFPYLYACLSSNQEVANLLKQKTDASLMDPYELVQTTKKVLETFFKISLETSKKDRLIQNIQEMMEASLLKFKMESALCTIL